MSIHISISLPIWIGLYLLLFIIFAETGIMIGFFLPGDPLLFIAGMIVSNITLSPEAELPTLLSWILLISLSAVLGFFLGYWCGKAFGIRIMRMKDTWFLKRHYIVKAQEFYKKRGGSAIVLARFLPVVRTFAPIVAGIVKMDFKKFVIYTILCAVIWIGSLVALGYLLGENPWVQRNLEFVILGIVLTATTPVILKAITGRRKVKTSVRHMLICLYFTKHQ